MNQLLYKENGVLVHAPDTSKTYAKEGTAYPRILCLKSSGSSNGTLLCTFELYGYVDGETVWPIYRSTDQGASWHFVTNVRDTQYGFGNKYQPVLYELPQQAGALPAGTVLLSGNSIPEDGSCSAIVVYKSHDGGSTWEYLSTVDCGGPIHLDEGADSTTTAIWEPFLGLDMWGGLVCYYSDERQKGNCIHQALVHRVSKDGGLTWGDRVNDVAIANKNDRPGMITVTRLPNGQYFAAYEVVNRPSMKKNLAPVYFKLSEDGVTWNPEDIGTRIYAADGTSPGATPYCKWVPAKEPEGMIIVASKWCIDSSENKCGIRDFFVNYNLGRGKWEKLPMAVQFDYEKAGYSQSFDINQDGRTLYHAASVENEDLRSNEIRVGARPLSTSHNEV